jgi:hypothetical protein
MRSFWLCEDYGNQNRVDWYKSRLSFKKEIFSRSEMFIYLNHNLRVSEYPHMKTTLILNGQVIIESPPAIRL